MIDTHSLRTSRPRPGRAPGRAGAATMAGAMRRLMACLLLAVLSFALLTAPPAAAETAPPPKGDPGPAAEPPPEGGELQLAEAIHQPVPTRDTHGRAPDPAEVDRLRAAASAAPDGMTRVMIEVDSAFTPEGQLESAAQAEQRETIDQVKADVARTAVDAGAVVTATFDSIPWMAVTATPDALTDLAANPAVAQMREDEQHVPTLRDSVPLIGATDVRDRGFDGTGWTVAVIDTGIDLTHGFLHDIVDEACFTRNTCPNGEQSQTGPGAAAACAWTNCDHGTHVAGIATGRADPNAALVANRNLNGVAPGASLLPIMAASQTGCRDGAPNCFYESDVIHGLEYVLARSAVRNIAAVNLSIGGGAHILPCDDSAYKAAIDNLAARNVSTVIAAGNDGWDHHITYPGCVSTAITVGATTGADALADFSNYSDMVDVLAPGDRIVSSFPGNRYGTMNGTSMAAPHVAGAIALMSQRAGSYAPDLADLFLSTTGVPVPDPAGQGRVVNRIRVDKAMVVSRVNINDRIGRNYRNPIPNFHEFDNSTDKRYWVVTATRPTAGLDVDLDVFDVHNYTAPLGGSHSGGSAIDFVAINSNTGHRGSNDYTFYQVKNYSGTGRYDVQYSNPGVVIGNSRDVTMASRDVVSVLDHYHVAGVATAYRVVPLNGGDIELAVASANYGDVQSRLNTANSTSAGPGGAESVSVTHSTSDYGAVILLQRSGSGTYRVYADTTAPAATVAINGDVPTTTSSNVTLTIDALDPDTGLLDMRIVTDGVPDTEPYRPFARSVNITLPAGAGSRSVALEVRNNAGQSVWAYDVINVVAQCNGQNATIIGSGVISGTAGNDVIVGSAGNDTINGLGGNDLICGRAGNDTIADGLGDDSVFGEDGNDVMRAWATVDPGDTYLGGNGVDQVSYSARTVGLNVSMHDNVGNDGQAGEGDNVRSDVEYLVGGAGNDTITGNASVNQIIGGNGNDIIDGQDGNDDLHGQAGNDVLRGGNGDDAFHGGAAADGSDTLDGQAGNDIVEYATRTTPVTLTLDGYRNDGAAGELDIIIGMERVYGGAGNDTISGGAGNETLVGNAGNDTLTGNAGNDTINGGAGNDTINGGLGNDYEIGGDGNDRFIAQGTVNGADVLDGQAGVDTIDYSARMTAVTVTMNDVVSNDGQAGEGDRILNAEILLGGNGFDNITGSSAAETLDGGAGNDTIKGGAGNDTVRGGVGHDALNTQDGVNGNDTADGGLGADTAVTDPSDVKINIP